MKGFKRLELEDRDLFQTYLSKHNFRTYEYSFINLYLWRRMCEIEYTIIDNALIIKQTEDKKGSFFMQPLGYSLENLSVIIKELMSLKEIYNMKVLFRDIEEPFLEDLKKTFGENMEFYEDVNNFDYIYEVNKLIDLPGEKLRKKKLQYKQFVGEYDYSLKDIKEEGVAKDCIKLSEDWLMTQKKPSKLLYHELNGIKDVLQNTQFLDLMGMAVYVGSNLAGFTVGEKFNKDLGIIHIEKGDISYKGIYAFLNKTFAEKYLSSVAYINREEDMGVAGLRKAKLAYDPVKLEKKYIVIIR